MVDLDGGLLVVNWFNGGFRVVNSRKNKFSGDLLVVENDA